VSHPVRYGDATLYLGDALDLLPTFPVGAADLCVVDPPYMIGVASSGSDKLNPWADLCNGARFFEPIIRQLRRITYPRGAVWWFCNWRGLPSIQKAAFDAGWKIESLLVWDKCWIGPGGQRGLRPSYELVALMAHDDFALPNRGLPDIWQSPVSSQKPNGHPAEKPIDLCRRLIRESPGSTVLDPFMGVGTSGVAALAEGRKFIGVEIDGGWFAAAGRRINASTAQTDFLTDPKEIAEQCAVVSAYAAAFEHLTADELDEIERSTMVAA
jgi:site-specific DNA-methyltransferase (adenine-specific)